MSLLHIGFLIHVWALSADPGAKRKDSEIVVAANENKTEGGGAPAEKAMSKGLPCMDRLREELSCAVRSFFATYSLDLISGMILIRVSLDLFL